MPKLLIIQATGYRARGVRVPYKLLRKRKLVGAVLPYLAALAPKEWDVKLLDDATEKVDYEADVDAVAITIRTVTSLRGYEIARRFRDRNIPVLMGGPHATFHAEEIAGHADAARTLEAADRAHILEALEGSRWVLGGPNGAATRLGLKRSTLQFRMKKLAIAKPALR